MSATGIIRNDNLDIRVGKPTRNTDTVGGVNDSFADKDLIPLTYRHPWMETIDETGKRWRLENPNDLSAWSAVSTLYTLPKATTSVLGGVKVGSNLSVDTGGIISGRDISGSVSSSDGEVCASSWAVKTAYDKGVSAYNLADSKFTSKVANTTLGLVKSGTDISVDGSGNVSVNNNSHTHVKSNITDLSVGDNNLTEKNFTATLKTKLDGIENGAEVNVQSNWTSTGGDSFIQNKPTKLSDFTDDTVSGNYLPIGGGTLTGALTGTSATFTSGISAGDGSVYSAHLRSSSGARGIKLFDYNNDVIGGLDWGTDGLFFRNSSDDYIFRAFTTDKRLALYGALSGTSAVFSGIVGLDAIRLKNDDNYKIYKDGNYNTINLKANGKYHYFGLYSSIAGTPETDYALKVWGKGKFTGDLTGTSATFSGDLSVHNQLSFNRIGASYISVVSGQNLHLSYNKLDAYGSRVLTVNSVGVAIGSGVADTETGYALKVHGKGKFTGALTGTSATFSGGLDTGYGAKKFWTGTQAEYTAIGTGNYDSSTLYFILKT